MRHLPIYISHGPLVVQRIACKSSDSFFLDQIFDRHETFPEGKSLWQLRRSSHSDQTESQQICQNDSNYYS
uniref:Uncharacterized protein n=1 Tax=Arundo donax TaxID=35708 RepID=A0A0A9DUV3_ARUDO